MSEEKRVSAIEGMENTECVIKRVFAFTVPPRSSSSGWKASEWSKQPIWVGQLRVVSNGKKCAIYLENTDKSENELFAVCPVENKQTVEQVVDSTRYFVLRVSNGKGRYANIGIGFEKREEAFDFKVSLQDFENQSNAEERATQYLNSIPSSDLALPENKTIHVNFGSQSQTTEKKDKSKGEKKLVALAPPPSDSNKSRVKRKSGSGPAGVEPADSNVGSTPSTATPTPSVTSSTATNNNAVLFPMTTAIPTTQISNLEQFFVQTNNSNTNNNGFINNQTNTSNTKSNPFDILGVYAQSTQLAPQQPQPQPQQMQLPFQQFPTQQQQQPFQQQSFQQPFQQQQQQQQQQFQPTYQQQSFPQQYPYGQPMPFQQTQQLQSQPFNAQPQFIQQPQQFSTQNQAPKPSGWVEF